jgi:N-acetylglucosamine-6-phosphate deacetylase
MIKTDLIGIHYETGEAIRIRAEDGIITKVSELRGKSPGLSDLFIAPGLIDNQVNGYAGIDFGSRDLDPGKIMRATVAMWKDGVTTYLPTLVTAAHEDLLKNFSVLASSISDKIIEDCIPGFHLEGPYLSGESGFFGCHPVEYLRDPSLKEFEEYQKAAGGRISILTIAPELPGAMDLIKFCSGKNIRVSLGHTNATANQIDEAVKSGARLSTHLGNGCANMIHRHNNPLWPQLANEKLTPSIIADGHHLLDEEIKVFLKVKGPGNIILTSDVTFLIGMEPGEYEYMGSRIVKTGDGLIKNPELNCLAGASFPLKAGVEKIMGLPYYTPGQAINMASKNVAGVLNLNDRGTLDPGKRADIIMFKLINGKIKIKETYKGGKLVYSDSIKNK